jgi:hypothetical protein
MSGRADPLRSDRGVSVRVVSFALGVVLCACAPQGAVTAHGPHDERTTEAPRAVGVCDRLPAAGQWQNVSPPGMAVEPPYTGALEVLLDPRTSGTVYVTTSQSGVFKSTDCGATWVKRNTGRNAEQLDSGRIWSAVIDPLDPQTLYALTGYGPAGVWKSTNGGVDWDQVLPANAGMPGFVARVALDPSEHSHLLINFHENCTGVATPVCFGETKDGGATWRVLDFPPSLQRSWAEGTFVLPIDATHWLYENTGLYYSGDAGATWRAVTPTAAIGIQGPYFRTPDGTFYLAAANGVITSPDGATWSQIANSGNALDIVVGDGFNLFAIEGFQPPQSAAFAWTAPYAQPSNWTVLRTPGLPSPPSAGANDAAYDSDHGVLYTADQAMGLWRTVTDHGHPR